MLKNLVIVVMKESTHLFQTWAARHVQKYASFSVICSEIIAVEDNIGLI